MAQVKTLQQIVESSGIVSFTKPEFPITKLSRLIEMRAKFTPFFIGFTIANEFTKKVNQLDNHPLIQASKKIN